MPAHHLNFEMMALLPSIEDLACRPSTAPRHAWDGTGQARPSAAIGRYRQEIGLPMVPDDRKACSRRIERRICERIEGGQKGPQAIGSELKELIVDGYCQGSRICRPAIT